MFDIKASRTKKKKERKKISQVEQSSRYTPCGVFLCRIFLVVFIVFTRASVLWFVSSLFFFPLCLSGRALPVGSLFFLDFFSSSSFFPFESLS